MIAEDALTRLAAEIAEVPGVVGVTLGGSRARGDATPDSDVDLGIYYARGLDIERLTHLAARHAGDSAQLTQPGEWGDWVRRRLAHD